MRSELLPVARKSNESNWIDLFAAFFGDRVPSENASAASNVLGNLILCKKMNVAVLAFSEIRLPNILLHQGTL